MKGLIALIPARGGSKRLVGKNLMEIGGVSLIGHSILYAQQYFDKNSIYVSTEDPAIKEESQKFGVQVIDRPVELALDHTPTVNVLQHFLKMVSKKTKHIVLLQPTNPLRPPDLLDNAYKVYQQTNVSSLFTVNPERKKLGEIDKYTYVPLNYEPGQRSQDMTPWYYENGLLYIASRGAIESGQLIGRDSHPFVMDHIFGSIDIDTEEDYLYAQYIFEHYRHLFEYLH